jgi:hypothetical protein
MSLFRLDPKEGTSITSKRHVPLQNQLMQAERALNLKAPGLVPHFHPRIRAAETLQLRSDHLNMSVPH